MTKNQFIKKVQSLVKESELKNEDICFALEFLVAYYSFVKHNDPKNIYIGKLDEVESSN